MKRSEMIKLLQNYVYDATDGDIMISPDESKLLLGFIEKAGMLPPLNEENYHFMDNAAKNHVNQAKWYFSWESEDEND